MAVRSSQSPNAEPLWTSFGSCDGELATHHRSGHKPATATGDSRVNKYLNADVLPSCDSLRSFDSNKCNSISNINRLSAVSVPGDPSITYHYTTYHWATANMVFARVASIILRIAELAFATIVAGINGDYLHNVRNTSSWSQGRFIYTEVVAGIAIFFSLIWLIPFSGTFVHWPVDLVISVAWFAAFGLLVDVSPKSCAVPRNDNSVANCMRQYLGGSCGAVFDWNNLHIIRGDQCSKWKAVMAFSFLSAICWLVSAIIGLIWVHDRERRTYQRRTWRSRSRV
ncbi:hypothetical protein FHL15_007143 [Xylaria flabelliformis]|uniref:MARVEL domain-containing protein n=1 Tax=Xylaria flabelliformis TaxID=2512241 RepID=A0A553HVR9_9PEZI|nr:hypothetical protein FHL15_007143 [Xylaria flabelliformis]